MAISNIEIQDENGNIYYPKTASNNVFFEDGTTFQQKLDGGALRGQQGSKGDTGEKGERGERGIQGLPGVNGKDGVSVSTNLVDGIASGSVKGKNAKDSGEYTLGTNSFAFGSSSSTTGSESASFGLRNNAAGDACFASGFDNLADANVIHYEIIDVTDNKFVCNLDRAMPDLADHNSYNERPIPKEYVGKDIYITGVYTNINGNYLKHKTKIVSIIGLNTIEVESIPVNATLNNRFRYLEILIGDSYPFDINLDISLRPAYQQLTNRGAMAIGSKCTATASGSMATGHKTSAFGICSSSEGMNNISNGAFSHTEGYGNIAFSGTNHAEGWGNLVSETTLFKVVKIVKNGDDAIITLKMRYPLDRRFIGKYVNITQSVRSIGGIWFNAHVEWITRSCLIKDINGIDITVNLPDDISSDAMFTHYNTYIRLNSITDGRYICNHVDGSDNVACGGGNTVSGYDNYVSSFCSNVSGYGNNVFGSYNIVSGSGNEVPCDYNLVAGSCNTVVGNMSLNVGEYNIIMNGKEQCFRLVSYNKIENSHTITPLSDGGFGDLKNLKVGDVYYYIDDMYSSNNMIVCTITSIIDDSGTTKVVIDAPVNQTGLNRGSSFLIHSMNFDFDYQLRGIKEGGLSSVIGYKCLVSGAFSHSGGYGSYTVGTCSFTHAWSSSNNGRETAVFGRDHQVTGNGSLVVGGHNNIVADYSFISGESNIIKTIGNEFTEDHVVTHASVMGYNLRAYNFAQTIIGVINIDKPIIEPVISGNNVVNVTDLDLFVVGNGTERPNGMGLDRTGSNAFRVKGDGSVYSLGNYNSTGADYAEFFEWLDENPENQDRVGHFVTMDGDKIRYAEPEDDYILGITSGNPSVIGNSYNDIWNEMYIKDEFDRIIYEDIEIPDKYETIHHEAEYETKADPIQPDKKTEPVLVKEAYDEEVLKIPKHIEHVMKLNPLYDPSKDYIPREKRPEWSAVGMLGVLPIYDDGTCVVNGYATVSKNGTATSSQRGYKVIKRLSDNIVKILFRS